MTDLKALLRDSQRFLSDFLHGHDGIGDRDCEWCQLSARIAAALDKPDIREAERPELVAGEFLEGSAIIGCRHTKVRQKVWVDDGACPICLTASVGMADDTAKEPRNMLADMKRLNHLERENTAMQKQRAERAESALAAIKASLREPTREMVSAMCGHPVLLAASYEQDLRYALIAANAVLLREGRE